MAAGLANTALIASRGLAIPVPPMAREMGPMAIKLSPLVAQAVGAASITRTRTAINFADRFITFSSLM